MALGLNGTRTGQLPTIAVVTCLFLKDEIQIKLYSFFVVVLEQISDIPWSTGFTMDSTKERSVRLLRSEFPLKFLHMDKCVPI